MIERVVIREDWQTGGHRVFIVGRSYPGARASLMAADGSWQELEEGTSADAAPAHVGITLPDGALEAIVAAAQNVTAVTPATERHLSDAVTVRDRLLSIIEAKEST